MLLSPFYLTTPSPTPILHPQVRFGGQPSRIFFFILTGSLASGLGL
jgi:hypothetical protein